MRQQVLKALANPSQLFGVPYTLAVLNFMVQFGIFIILFIGGLLIFGNDIMSYVNPLYFLISVCVVHMFFARFTKNDAQFGQVLMAKIKMIKNKIPRRLSA